MMIMMNSSRGHFLSTEHVPGILRLMLPAPWDVSIVEVTVVWTEEVGYREGK